MVEISSETKGIVWDLDGTLLNSFGIFKGIILQLVPEFNLEPPTEEVFLTNYHGLLEESLKGVLGKELSRDILNEVSTRFLERQDELYRKIDGFLFEDAVDLSRKIQRQKIPQALLTNRGHKNRGNASPRSIVERSALKGVFDIIISGDDIEVRKPDKKVVKDILGRWGVEPSDLLVIGDQHVDAQLALNLGAEAIIICRDGLSAAPDRLQAVAQAPRISIVDSLDQVRTRG